MIHTLHDSPERRPSLFEVPNPGQPSLAAEEPSNSPELLFDPNDFDIQEVTLGDKPYYLMRFFDGDPRFQTMADAVVKHRQEEYKRAHLLNPSAKEADDIRGRNVEIYALIDQETFEPVVSLRKVHSAQPGGFDEAPCYAKFAQQGAFSSEGHSLLEQRSAGRPVVEIAALWNSLDDFEATLILYKQAIHESMAKNELWFMGVVTKLHRSLTKMFGETVVRTLGNEVEVKGEDAEEHVRIVPALIDPQTFFDDLLGEIHKADEASDLRSKYDKEGMWWDFVSGLSDQLIRKLGVRHD